MTIIPIIYIFYTWSTSGSSLILRWWKPAGCLIIPLPIDQKRVLTFYQAVVKSWCLIGIWTFPTWICSAASLVFFSFFLACVKMPIIRCFESRKDVPLPCHVLEIWCSSASSFLLSIGINSCTSLYLIFSALCYMFLSCIRT